MNGPSRPASGPPQLRHVSSLSLTPGSASSLTTRYLAEQRGHKIDVVADVSMCDNQFTSRPASQCNIGRLVSEGAEGPFLADGGDHADVSVELRTVFGLVRVPAEVAIPSY